MRSLIFLAITSFFLLTILGCNKEVEARSDNGTYNNGSGSKSISLTIVGYNYTTRYIDSFSVNGNGGGNIMRSTPESGGGGAVCCALYRPEIKNYKAVVRWQSDACVYHVRSSTSNEVFKQYHSYFKEIEVPVTKEFRKTPKNILNRNGILASLINQCCSARSARIPKMSWR
jgi:hypothetical protein